MPAVSSIAAPMARKSAQTLLRSLARMPLETIAQALSKDESTASRVRSGEARVTVGEFCELVDAAGLKLVSADKYCVDRALWVAVTTMLAATMADKESVQRLVW